MAGEAGGTKGTIDAGVAMAAAMKEQPRQGDVLLLLTKEDDVYSHKVVDPLMWHDPDQLPHCAAWFRKTKVMWRRRDPNPPVNAGDVVIDQDGVPIVVTSSDQADWVDAKAADLPQITALYRKVWDRGKA